MYILDHNYLAIILSRLGNSTLLFLVGVTGSRCSLEILTTFSVSCKKTEHIPPCVKQAKDFLFCVAKLWHLNVLDKNEQGIKQLMDTPNPCKNQPRASQHGRICKSKTHMLLHVKSCRQSHLLFKTLNNKNFTHGDTANDAGLIDDTSIQECVFHTHHDICGDPVIGGLVDVRSRGVRVVASRRRSSRSHRTVPYRTGTRTSLRSTWSTIQNWFYAGDLVK